MSAEPPLSPQSVADLAWGLSLYFSKDDQERTYGEDVKKRWDEMQAKESKPSVLDSKFFHNIFGALSGAIYDLARLRQQVADHFKFVEDLKNRRLNSLDDLVNLTADGQSVATRIGGISIGGGVSFIQLASNALGPREMAYIVFGGAVAYIISEAALRVFRLINTQRILTDAQMRKDTFLHDQFEPRSKVVLNDLLAKVNEISKELFKTSLEDKKIQELVDRSSSVHTEALISGKRLSIPFLLPGAPPINQ